MASMSQTLSGVLGREEEPLRKTFSRTITETRAHLTRRATRGATAKHRNVVLALVALPFIAAVFSVAFAPSHVDYRRRKASIAAKLVATRREIDRALIEYGDTTFDMATFLLARDAAVQKYSRDLEPRYSVISACKDRSSFLAKALPSWQAAISSSDEIILVDWSTEADHMPIRDMPEIREDPRIQVVTVQNQLTWILSRAFNLAASFARGEVLLKVDCDTRLDPKFLEAHNLQAKEFYRPNFGRARNANEQHLNGVFLMERADFEAIRGFDERLTTYGWDDSDLYERAIDYLDLAPKNIRFETLEHIEHSDTYRSAHQKNVASPMIQTQFNSIALKELPPWMNESESEVAKARYSFQTVRGLHGTYNLVAQAQTNHPGLDVRLSVAKTTEVFEKARDRVLHDVYSLPWDVLKQVDVERDDLLEELEEMYPRGWIQNAGSMFVELSGSPATRMLCLASCVALAKKFKRPLFVSWDHSEDKNATTQLSDFFNPNLIGGPEGESSRIRSELVLFSVKKLGCSRNVDHCKEFDSSYRHFVEYDNVADPFANARIIRHLNGTGEFVDRRHVILRLGQPLSTVPKHDIAEALVNLVPSLPLEEMIKSFGDVTGSVALFLGDKLSQKAQHAVVQRFVAYAKKDKRVFVIGHEPKAVANVRRQLGPIALKPKHDVLNATSLSLREATLAKVAELYAMGILCKDISRDGHVPKEILELITTFESVKQRFKFAGKKL